MSKLTDAERYLLDRIRQGDAEGWSQLVDRYEGRLRAFAWSKLHSAADADDLVQETFVAFLKAQASFREQASLETFLFAILRRKIMNAYRGRASRVCLLQDTLAAGDEANAGDGADQLAAPDPTASWYARRDEEQELQQAALASALHELISDLKTSLNFRDLQIVEMLFYCQFRNKDIARLAGVSENHIAIIKHRSLKRIQQHLGRDARLQQTTTEPGDALLTRIWQEQRLSCPKRSTIGNYLLGTLEDDWNHYVAFHLDRLGCTFCRANLEDLEQQTADDGARALRERILQSTVGFLRSS